MSTTTKDVDIRDLALAVAKLMPGYAVKPREHREWWAILIHADKAQPGFFIQNDRTIGRVRISVEYEGHLGYREEVPEITVSATKTPEKIAQDITKRLLPIALAFHTRRMTAKNESDAYHAGRRARAENLSEILGKPVTHKEERDGTGTSEIYLTGIGRLVIHGIDSVEIKFYNLNGQDATRLAKAILNFSTYQ